MELQPTKEGVYPKDKDDQVISNLFEITNEFERFNQCNEMFCRSQWDSTVKSKKAIDWFKSMLTNNLKFKTTDGYTQKDFALRNAGWTMANLAMERKQDLNRRDGFLDDITAYLKPSDTKFEVASAEEMSLQIKQVGKLFGADMIGITAVDHRWHYSHKFDADTRTEKPNNLSDELTNCIVVGTEMSYDVVRTYPSALAGVAPGFGYSKDAVILQTLSQFIRNLGYEAVSSLNDTAQAIPYAIQAGLAEYGRNGLAITKEFGPRVRFGKIFTNLPLVHDKPINFGVKSFCEICQKCADACPAKAISFDEPTDKIINKSNITGIKKWTVDGEKCFSIWANQGSECGICIRVCPYNKGHETAIERIYFRIFKRLAFSPAKRIALWLDDTLGFGKRKTPSWWWKKNIK